MTNEMCHKYKSKKYFTCGKNYKSVHNITEEGKRKKDKNNVYSK